MGKYSTLSALLSAIADAIRSKTGGKAPLAAAELNVQLRAVGHELAPMAAHGLRFVYHKLRALFHAWGKIRSFSHSHVLSHSCPKV